MIEYVNLNLASPPAATCAATATLSPAIEYVAPTPVFDAAPAPVTYHVTPAPADSYATPATVNTYVASATVIAQIASPSAATSFVSPQFTSFAVEASASQVVGSFPSEDETASPVYNQVHQEQIAAEQESVERVEQHTVEQLVHVPIPQIQEQLVEGDQVIPRELFTSESLFQFYSFPPPFPLLGS